MNGTENKRKTLRGRGREKKSRMLARPDPVPPAIKNQSERHRETDTVRGFLFLFSRSRFLGVWDGQVLFFFKADGFRPVGYFCTPTPSMKID